MNPYASPADTAPGKYDWSLLKRILRAVTVIAVITLAITSAALWQQYRQQRAVQGVSTVDQLIGFFSDWRHAARQPQ